MQASGDARIHVEQARETSPSEPGYPAGAVVAAVRAAAETLAALQGSSPTGRRA
jgi:monoamine oxidase